MAGATKCGLNRSLSTVRNSLASPENEWEWFVPDMCTRINPPILSSVGLCVHEHEIVTGDHPAGP
jgi:hypothetical protein